MRDIDYFREDTIYPDNESGNANHGQLELRIYLLSQIDRRKYGDNTLLYSIVLKPGYSLNEEKALAFLYFWARQRGYYGDCSWSSVNPKERKFLSNEQKYNRALTFWKNRLFQKFPLFAEEEFLRKKEDLKRRYNI